MSTTHPLFPVRMPTTWQQASQFSLPSHLLDWLLNPSSLTVRLKRHCQTFEVKVLGEAVQQCSEQEANSDIPAGTEVLVREVLLLCDNKPHVFARSLLPLSSLTGEQKALAQLGNQPLGNAIFHHGTLIRKAIEVASFDANSTVASLCQALDLSITKPIWGRRSVFVLDSKPLMVAEVFLPDAVAYKDEVNRI